MDLLPESLTRDPQIKACIEGLDEELRKLSSDIRETLLISRIDELSEDILDLLAWQFHLDFYQPTELNIETKRQLIRESIADHRIRGTPAAVEKLLTTVFKGAQVKEWWEFDGEPYTFRIEQLGHSFTSEQDFKDFEVALDISKNVRSHLESFTIRLIRILEMFVGLANFTLLISKKPYKANLYSQLINNFIGFTKIQSITRNDRLKFGGMIPESHIYLGFTQKKHIDSFIPAQQADFPIHDLRSTSILDLLILGLGILREDQLKPRMLFLTHFESLKYYLGVILNKNISIKPNNKINLYSKNTQNIAFLTNSNKFSDRRLIVKNGATLPLFYYILAARTIIHFIDSFNMSEPVATLKRFNNLNFFADIASISSKCRKSTLLKTSYNDLKNHIAFFIAKSIFRKDLSADRPSILPITLYRTDKLHLFHGFAQNISVSYSRSLYSNQFNSLNLNLNIAYFKHIESNINAKTNSIASSSKVFIANILFKRLFRYFLSLYHINKRFLSYSISYSIALAQLTLINKKSKIDIESRQLIDLKAAILTSRSIFRKDKTNSFTIHDADIDSISLLNYYFGFTFSKFIDKNKRNDVDLSQKLPIHVDIISFRAIIHSVQNLDAPDPFQPPISLTSKSILYVDLIIFKSFYSHNNLIVNQKTSINIYSCAYFIDFIHINKKISVDSTNLNHNYSGILSFKSKYSVIPSYNSTNISNSIFYRDSILHQFYSFIRIIRISRFFPALRKEINDG